MNVQFGSAINTPHSTGAQGSDARASVAVPADAENRSTTSFTPVQEPQEQSRSKQEDAQQGVDSRQANNQQRVDRQNERKEVGQQRNRQQEQRQELDKQQQERIENNRDDQAQVERQTQARRTEEAAQQRQLQAELQQIQKLAERDREVIAHEQAHNSVGGQYAKAMSLTYERGPDGQNYAVAGEVSIDTGKIANDPQANLDKAQTIRRAALAPANPSSQDRKVAAQAIQMSMEAQANIQRIQREEVAMESADNDKQQDSDQGKRQSEAERLDAKQKTQSDELEEQSTAQSAVADLQQVNERMARIQAQLVAISQLDEKAKASSNLLDVVT